MTQTEAKQIAALLNTRNQLTTAWSETKVLDQKDEFVFIAEADTVIACAQSKKVSWYQWEICHVSIKEEYQRQGFASQILKLAEDKAISEGAKILQCTIRSNNGPSQNLFVSKGYIRTCAFYNVGSSNWVNVYQKSVSIK